MISKQVSYGKKGFKYLIGYKDDEAVNPLSIILLNMFIRAYNLITNKINRSLLSLPIIK